MTAPSPSFVAVDWGTTRMRASLIGSDGDVLDRRQSDAGVQSIAAGGFPAALDTACGGWFAASPGLPVVMAGMVGSRNGWVEAPYVACPCGPEEIAARLSPVPGAGRDLGIVPGVDCRWADGSYDVMRGEETQAIGTGVRQGLLSLPGTHGKWIEIVDGRIARFATFVTGELFAAVSTSFVARLAEAPDDLESGQRIAVGAAAAPGGLTRQLFQARARVLAGDLDPHGVRPYLSRLLVEAEIIGALDLFGRPCVVHLVAGEPQLGVYRAALAERGLDVVVHDPAAVTLAGLKTLMAARRSA